MVRPRPVKDEFAHDGDARTFSIRESANPGVLGGFFPGCAEHFDGCYRTVFA